MLDLDSTFLVLVSLLKPKDSNEAAKFPFYCFKTCIFKYDIVQMQNLFREGGQSIPH